MAGPALDLKRRFSVWVDGQTLVVESRLLRLAGLAHRHQGSRPRKPTGDLRQVELCHVDDVHDGRCNAHATGSAVDQGGRFRLEREQVVHRVEAGRIDGDCPRSFPTDALSIGVDAIPWPADRHVGACEVRYSGFREPARYAEHIAGSVRRFQCRRAGRGHAMRSCQVRSLLWRVRCATRSVCATVWPGLLYQKPEARGGDPPS